MVVYSFHGFSINHLLKIYTVNFCRTTQFWLSG